MAITGGVKFFEKSSALLKDGATVTASTGGGSEDNILSMNKYLRWDSVGSDDATAETLTIAIPSAAIDRIFIVDHNLKDYSITYGSGASAFTNVVGVNGAKSGIVETAYSLDTSYYEFDEVVTDQINITATKTQIADAQKYIHIFIATKEIGTLEGYPEVTPSLDANESRAKLQNGKYITQKNFEVFDGELELGYISQNDVDIMNSAYESQDPFIIWLCGGRYGNSNFSIDLKNWRLKDVFQVQTFGDMRTTFNSNVYVNNPFVELRMAEEI